MSAPSSYINTVLHQVHHKLGVDGAHPHYYGPNYHLQTPPLSPVRGPGGPSGPNQSLPQVSRAVIKIKKLALEIIEMMGKLWETIGKKTIKIAKILLESFSLAGSDNKLVGKIEFAISCLGLASLIEFCFDVRDAVKDIKQLKKDCKYRDGEGIGWSIADILTDFGGIAKTLISCGKTLNEFVKLPFITLFTAVTLPLSLVLLAYETIHSVYKLVRNSIEYAKLPSSAAGEEGLAAFKEYLAEKVGITEEERRKIIEAVHEKHGIIDIADTKTGADFSITIIKASTLSKKINFSMRRPLRDKGPEIEKEILRKCELLKSAKINRLKKNVDKRIVVYMDRNRVNLRFIEFYNLLDIARGHTGVANFLAHLSDLESRLPEGNDDDVPKKVKKERNAIQALREYIYFIEGHPDGTLGLEDKQDKELKAIQAKFNKRIKGIDKILEGYMMAHGKALRAAAEADKESRMPAASAPLIERENARSAHSNRQRVLPDEQTIAVKGLKDLKKLSLRKIVLHSIHVLTCLVEWTMHALSFILTPFTSAIVKLAFSGFKAGFSVFKEVYEFNLMQRGLEIPEFLPERRVL